MGSTWGFSFCWQMAEMNLTSKVASFLDPHLVLSMLDSVKEKGIFANDDISKAMLSVVEKTKLFEKHAAIAKDLGQSVDLEGKKKEVEELQNSFSEGCKQLLGWINDNASEIEKLKSEKKYSAATLNEKYMIEKKEVTALYRLAKLQYELGDYSSASTNLSRYISLTLDSDGESNDQYFSAIWGKLSADILNNQWKSAAGVVEEIRELIDSGVFGSALEQLHQRTWLLHWSLFPTFKSGNEDVSKFVETCFLTNYVNAIQTSAPHFLRYVVAGLILNTGKRRKTDVTELTRVLKQETYSDPITEFLESVVANFDFDNAQEKLKACSDVLSNDFFLCGVKDAFEENAKIFILEIYSQIHQCINMEVLADKMGISDLDQVKKWVEKASLNAKVENDKVKVIVSSSSVHEQLSEKMNQLLSLNNHVNSVCSQEN